MVTDTEAIVDIETNQIECQEDVRRNEQVTGAKRVTNALRSLGLTLSLKGLDKGENRNDSNTNVNDIESLINEKFEGQKEENVALAEKTQLKEKQKNKNSKKASKPPRPRRGPSLTASDLKLVKEISELVMKKRARIERLRSLKKLKQARSAPVASSNMSLFAMMITLLFLIVIIFQGFGSRTTGLVWGLFDSKLPK